IGDTLGGLQVLDGDKGLHVLAATPMVQYWIDQGLLGEKPLTELSGSGKALLDQITRGRSKDNEKTPPRVPRYSKAAQRGGGMFTGKASTILRKRVKLRADKGKKDEKPAEKNDKRKPPVQDEANKETHK